MNDGFRGGSRAAATSKMERFVIIVNGCCSSHRSASEQLNQTIFCTEATSVPPFEGVMISEIKKQLMLANFTIVMQMMTEQH